MHLDMLTDFLSKSAYVTAATDIGLLGLRFDTCDGSVLCISSTVRLTTW